MTLLGLWWELRPQLGVPPMHPVLSLVDIAIPPVA